MRILGGARRHWIPHLVLIAGLAATAATSLYARRAHGVQERLRFENTVEEVRHSLEGRLDAYVALLRGTAGLFAASTDVRAREFAAYVQRLALAERYQGVQGIGFTRVVRADEKEALRAQIRAEGLPFQFWPEQTAPIIHAIVFLEPRDARNLHALGFDMWTEPSRRQAMERACDTAEPAATARVRLVQEDVVPSEEQPGFLIYVPVYRGGSVPATEEQRRASLFGFVYSPFRAGDLLRPVIAPYLPATARVDVYDGDPAEGRLLHRSDRMGTSPSIESRRVIEIAGRRWWVVMYADANAADPIFRGVLALLVAGGLALSGLLFTITRTEISAREAAERTAVELRRSEEALRAAITAKDEFLAVVSHELRTPLNAIIGWSAMLRGGLLPPEQRQHAIDVIERNASAQARLVDDLLEISRAVGGRLRLDVGSVDVGATLRAAVDAVRPAAEARRISISWQGPSDLGHINGDAARLQQVFWNLLSNAIKFTPTSGRVTVSAERDDTTVRVAVHDTGVGISPEFLPHVFERFRQADASTTRAHGGVGLGLAIAQTIVELHGGTIHVHSEGPNTGSTFTVQLPRAPARR